MKRLQAARSERGRWVVAPQPGVPTLGGDGGAGRAPDILATSPFRLSASVVMEKCGDAMVGARLALRCSLCGLKSDTDNGGGKQKPGGCSRAPMGLDHGTTPRQRFGMAGCGAEPPVFCGPPALARKKNSRERQSARNCSTASATLPRSSRRAIGYHHGSVWQAGGARCVGPLSCQTCVDRIRAIWTDLPGSPTARLLNSPNLRDAHGCIHFRAGVAPSVRPGPRGRPWAAPRRAPRPAEGGTQGRQRRGPRARRSERACVLPGRRVCGVLGAGPHARRAALLVLPGGCRPAHPLSILLLFAPNAIDCAHHMCRPVEIVGGGALGRSGAGLPGRPPTAERQPGAAETEQREAGRRALSAAGTTQLLVDDSRA